MAEEEGLYEGKSPLELTKKELKDYVRKLEKEMKQAAGDLQLEGEGSSSFNTRPECQYAAGSGTAMRGISNGQKIWH